MTVPDDLLRRMTVPDDLLGRMTLRDDRLAERHRTQFVID